MGWNFIFYPLKERNKIVCTAFLDKPYMLG